jgi:hypothetical protein
MKPISNKQTVESSGIQKTVSFGIKSSGLHHILGILRNQLYSDKELAVIREYSCNAVDAHTVAGHPERPIEVTLPTKMSLFFKVRDFGPALSETEIQEVYAFYGESTKRNTNDQIGMLGIGSKAAFAYGDNYVINSFLDGKKYIYNAFIDPSQIGQISKIGEEPTKEENGIEIVVPVNGEDVDEFYKKSKDLFRWFNVIPKIKGHSQFEYENEALFDADGWKWLAEKRDRYDKGEAVAVMGNIGYPIDSYSLGDFDEEETNLQELLCGNLVMKFDIGDLEISASREKLQYTEYTRKKIKEKLKTVSDELISVISKEFSDCKTLWDAKCLMGSIFDMASNLYNLRNFVAKKMKFKGHKIGDDNVGGYYQHDKDKKKGIYQESDSVDIHTWKKSWRSDKYRGEETSRITANKKTVVIENDQGHRRGIMGKVLPFILEEEQNPYLIKFNSTKEKKDWLAYTGFDGDMLKLSELEKRPLSDFAGYSAAPAGSGVGEKNKKHSAKCFSFKFDHAGHSWERKKSAWWKIAEVDVANDKGVYVILDAFNIEKKVEGSHDMYENPHSLKQVKEAFDKAKIPFPKEVHGFKIKNRSDVEGKENWMSFWDYVRITLQTQLEEGNYEQAWADMLEIKELENCRDFTEDYWNWDAKGLCAALSHRKDELALKDVEGSAHALASNYGRMKALSGDANVQTIKDLCSHHGVKVNIKTEPSFSLVKGLKASLKRYELLEDISSTVWRNSKTKSMKSLVNYINLVDVCNNNPQT